MTAHPWWSHTHFERMIPMKRLAAFFTALCLLVPAASASFSDVAPWDWSYPAVEYVQAHGLMNGVGGDSFDPYGTVSRGMLATVLHRSAGSPHSVAGLYFQDIETGSWYIDSVIWCADAKIVTGIDATHFAPNDPVTREQVALMLWRLAGWPQARGSASVFTDASQISLWARGGVDWAYGAGIISGLPDGSFDPQGSANRSQVAQMLMNYMLWKESQG